MGDIIESLVVRPFSSSLPFTTTLLASGAIFTSNWFDSINGEKFFSLMAVSAQSGTYTVQFTEDTSLTSSFPASASIAYSQSTQTFMVSGGVASFSGVLPIPSRYFRVVYKNGPIAQTTFELKGSVNGNMPNTFGTYNTSLTPLTDGQSIPLQLDTAGNQKVNIAVGPGSSIGNPIYTTTNGASGTPNPAILTDTLGAGTIAVTDGVVAAPMGAGAFINGACTAGSYVGLANPGGMSSWDVQITGITTSGTLYFEASLDSTTGVDGNWIAVSGKQSGILNTVLNYFTTSNGNFRGNIAGMKYFRVRAVGTLAGTPNILIRFSSGPGAAFLDASLPAGTNTIGTVNVGTLSSDIAGSGLISVTDGVVGAPAGAGAFITGAPTANSYFALANAAGMSSWDVQITGITTSGTLYFEASLDSANGIDGNWIAVNGKQSGILNTVNNYFTTLNGAFCGNVSGMKYFRVRAVGTLAGTPTVTIRYSAGTGAVFLNSSLPAGTNTIGNVNIASQPNDFITTGLISVTDAIVSKPSGNGALLAGAPTAGSFVAAPNVGGTSTWVVQIIGITTAGTLYFETSLDATAGNNGNWTSVNGTEIGVTNAVTSISTIVNGIFQGNCTGAKWFRVRAVGTLAGTPNILIRFSTGIGTIALNSALPAGNNSIGNVNIGSTPDSYTVGIISVTDGVVPAPSGNGVLLNGAPTAGSFVSFANVGGTSGWDVQITGITTAGTLYFEASLDSITGIDGNWIAVNGLEIGATDAVLSYSTSKNGIFQGNIVGGKYFRVRAVGTLAGTPTVTIRFSAGVGTIALNASLPVGNNLIGNVNIGSQPVDIINSGLISVTDSVILAPDGFGTLISGTPTAGSYVVAANPGGTSTWIAQITGITTAGTLYFEASLDSTTGINGNWIAVNGRQVGILNSVINYSTTLNGIFEGNSSAIKYFRIRAVGTLAGTPFVLIRFSTSNGTVSLNNALPAGTNNIGSVNIGSQPDIITSGVITVTDGVVGPPLGNGALISGAPTAGSYVVATNPGGTSTWLIQVTGITTAGTLFFESSLDSTTGIDGNWISVNGQQSGVVNTVINYRMTTNGSYQGNVSGAKYFRVRAVGPLAGTPLVVIRLSYGSGSQYNIASISSQTAYSLGMYQIVNPWGAARVSVEPTALFTDTFDNGLDTTNKWNPVTIQGSATNTASSGKCVLNVGTTISNGVALTSLPTFVHQGVNFEIFATIVTLEIAPIATGNYRFWGLGTLGTGFSTTTPITDGVGFEIDITGSLNACVWASGIKIASVPIPATGFTPYGQPAPTWKDGNTHRYAIMFRSDAKFFFIDNQEIPVAIFNYKNSTNENVPICLLSINASDVAPIVIPKLTIGIIAFADSGANNHQISDGQFPWRKATVSSTGALSVNVNNPVITTYSYNATSSNTVLSSTPITIVSILVTTSPTVPVFIYDNSTTNTGTIIAAIPANTVIGSNQVFNIPAIFGAVIGGNVGNGKFTIVYK